MVKKECKTIETVVIGGEAPTAEDPEGSVADIATVKAISPKYNITNNLFNAVVGEDQSLAMVCTYEGIYVSKKSFTA